MTQRDVLNEEAFVRATIIEKIVQITWDGKQKVIKIPTKISRNLNLKKGDKVKFLLKIPEHPKAIKNSDLQIELI